MMLKTTRSFAHASLAASALLLIAVHAPFTHAVTSGPGTQISINDGSGATSYRNHLPPENEVHVIGVYETRSSGTGASVPGTPIVRIDYDRDEPMKPITLVLSSYEPNSWQLNIDPRASVERIILNGYHRQSVAGIAGVPVVNISGVESGGTWLGSCAIGWPLETGGCDTTELLVNVEDLLDTRVSSFTGLYRASSFTVTGAPASQQAVNPRRGAGNLSDGPNPNLIYDATTGEVQIDFDALPSAGPRDFLTERFYLSLANHDGSFNVDSFDPADMQSIAVFNRAPALNENRLGYDSVHTRNWDGRLISLGELLPTGMCTPAELRDYLAAAAFATDNVRGEFDLIVLVPEPSCLALLSFAGMVIGGRVGRHDEILVRRRS